MKQTLLALGGALLLASCAQDRAFVEGERLLSEGRSEEGIRQLEQAVQAHPGNARYRAALAMSREAFVNVRLAHADAALRDGRLDEAEWNYREVLRIHPENLMAPAGLSNVARARQPAAAPDPAKAGQPGRAGAAGASPLSPRLAEAFRRPVTLAFREAPLKLLFDAFAQQSGLNFVFDRAVDLAQPGSVFARETPLADALDMVLAAVQLKRKVLNDNTVMIFPNTPEKIQEHDDWVVKSFFLADADAKQALSLVKALAKVRDAHVDEKLNVLIVRDTAEVVALAGKLIGMIDRPEPEVMLEVEILEVKRAKLQELGVQWPTQFSLLNAQPSSSVATVNGVTTVTTPAASALTVQSLKSMSARSIAINGAGLNLRKDEGDVNLLANPRIRVKSREKAKIHIGDRVPVITANTTSTGVVSESVNYLDVGLKLDVEPLVRLEGDVEIRVGLEVSNIVREISSGNGTLTYQLGSRNAATMLRLRDGETQILAGLISDEDRRGATKIPGLGDLPLLGRLFSTQKDEQSKTEIVLLITPHIVRNILPPGDGESEIHLGSGFAGAARASEPSAGPSEALPAGQAPTLLNLPNRRRSDGAPRLPVPEPGVETAGAADAGAGVVSPP